MQLFFSGRTHLHKSGRPCKRVMRQRRFRLPGAVLILCGCLLLLTSCASDDVTPIGVLPTPTPGPRQPVSLQAIHMVSAKGGWAITHDERILHTLDGPAHWSDVTPGSGTADLVGATIQASYFADVNVGWVAASNANKVTIWRTFDGGELWYPTPLAEPAQRVISLQFTDGTHGWLLLDTTATGTTGTTATAGDEAVRLLYTLDGGSTWLPLDSADAQSKDVPQHLPFSGLKTGVTFTSNAQGWLTGSLSRATDHQLVLYVSQDGGFSWQVRNLKTPVPTATALSSLAPTFFDANNAVLSVTLTDPQPVVSIYRTMDGGNNWRSAPPNAAISANVSFVNANTGWAIGSGDHRTSVYATTDGGQSWRPTTQPGRQSGTVDALDFISATDGWILVSTTNGQDTLYQTTDGGTSWSVQTTTASLS
jgi:Uncharacterized protein related to plant photosystem II stability/assembly factor